METKGFKFDQSIEPATRKRYSLTVFGIGTMGLQVVGHLDRLPIRNTRFIVCHTEKEQLMASCVGNKLLYDIISSCEDEEQYFIDLLSDVLKSSELSIIVTDLSNPVDGYLATSAVQVIAEQNEFSLAALSIPFILDSSSRERTSQTMSTLQQQANSVLLYEQTDTSSQEQSWHLAEAIFQLTEFCQGFLEGDYDDLRKVISSPGQIAIARGKSGGNERTQIAFDEMTTQINRQSFATRHTRGIMLIVEYSRYRPLLVRDHTNLMNHIAAFIETEPAVVKQGFIQDDYLLDEMILTMLLWAPYLVE